MSEDVGDVIAPDPVDPELSPPSEPAAVTGTLVALGTVIINGMLLFGRLSLSTDQKTYVLGAIAVIAPIVAGVWIRFKVWSPATVARIVAAYRAELAQHQQAVVVAQAQAQATKDTLSAALPAAIQGVLANVPAQAQRQAPQMPTTPPRPSPPVEPSTEYLAPRQEPVQPAPPPPLPLPHEPWSGDHYPGPYDPGYGYQPQPFERETGRHRPR